MTSRDCAGLLDGAAHTVPSERVLRGRRRRLRRAALDAARAGGHRRPALADDDLYLLIFTSGSTGLPKAVRCTQGRIARTGAHVAGIAELAEGDVVYTPLPFFHAALAVHRVGVGGARRRPDLDAEAVLGIAAPSPTSVRFGATFLTYTGKVLNYILAVPERPDDADDPLRLAIGNEASEHDIREFARRFGCHVRDSYGSTEGIIIIRRDATCRPARSGRPNDSVEGGRPRDRRRVPAAVVRRPTAGSSNLDEAVGEIVETEPTVGLRGLLPQRGGDAASASATAAYWSGDLAYRDADGWFYFAGRSNDWLRVDGENFAAGPVEAIIARHPDVRSVAVYAVPDDPVGDRVMVALELADRAEFDPAAFDAFLDRQPDLGTEVAARVRAGVDDELPKLASMKVDKMRLAPRGVDRRHRALAAGEG